jgi:hypothetical protein
MVPLASTSSHPLILVKEYEGRGLMLASMLVRPVMAHDWCKTPY